jgi:hypothetical protein
MAAEVGATQNVASPTAELHDDVVAVPDAVKDGCAKRGLVEGQRLAWAVDRQLGLDARHRNSWLE